ncbi:MAG TPA: sterol desaturase family protein [Gammaproteobacteria bacterium]|nr:sterol desaturase family protein [Gammaproteobacteria bacterium]
MQFESFLQQHEIALRLSAFFGILLLMALWERRRPCRTPKLSILLRWTNNLGLVIVNSVLLRWLFPNAAVGVAALSAEQGWGVLHYYAVNHPLAIFLSIIALDGIIYLQHVMVHAVPLLWRIHRVHHADPDFDVTTGSRFHPIEIILSMLIKFASILVLGPPVVAVILFEIILNGMAMFNHSNITLPSRIDKVLRILFVTPDMHRVHHSVEEDETNSNFGFNLSLWDRMFGTYKTQPRLGQKDMVIGILGHQDPKSVTWLSGLLLLPLRPVANQYTINRRHWEQSE